MWFLLQFGRLYQIERELRDAHADAPTRKARRAAEAPPILATIHHRLLQLDPSQPGARLLPKSPLGKAVRYALAEWEAVSRYQEEGHYEIDNNQTYAARGINEIMPTVGLCRVAGWNPAVSA